MENIFDGIDAFDPIPKKKAPSKMAACFYVSYKDKIDGSLRMQKCITKKELKDFFLAESTNIMDPIVIKGVELDLELVSTYRVK